VYNVCRILSQRTKGCELWRGTFAFLRALGERAGRFLFPTYAHVCVIFAWNSAGRVNLKMIPTHWTRVICNANSIFGSFCVAEQIMAPLCSSAAEIKVIRAADGNLEIWCNYKESAQIAS
jgi:hypothetical protein